MTITRTEGAVIDNPEMMKHWVGVFDLAANMGAIALDMRDNADRIDGEISALFERGPLLAPEGKIFQIGNMNADGHPLSVQVRTDQTAVEDAWRPSTRDSDEYWRYVEIKRIDRIRGADEFFSFKGNKIAYDKGDGHNFVYSADGRARVRYVNGLYLVLKEIEP